VDNENDYFRLQRQANPAVGVSFSKSTRRKRDRRRIPLEVRWLPEIRRRYRSSVV